MMPQKWRDAVDALANDEVSTASKSRMLIIALAASNWVTLQMILLYVTDLVPARSAVHMAVYATIIVFAVYAACSRLPAIARNLQWAGGLRD